MSVFGSLKNLEGGGNSMADKKAIEDAKKRGITAFQDEKGNKVETGYVPSKPKKK